MIGNFFKQCIENKKTRFMFPENPNYESKRRKERFNVVFSRHQGLAKSAMPTMISHLNKKYG